MDNIIALVAAERVYQQGAVSVVALHPTSLTLGRGEFVAITGRSGSGKSTFLNLITGIDRPTAGDVIVDGISLNSLSESSLAQVRGRKIGIVFQFFELVPTLTVIENVILAMDLVDTVPVRERRSRALGFLDQVGVADQARKLPSRLSGGQQQRVAIARALANDPSIIVADEPSGNLDTTNSERVFEIFASLAKQGRTIVVATHEQAGLGRYDRVLHVTDGRFTDPTLSQAA
jgi:putative ABC transport system ATP-binding protein